MKPAVAVVTPKARPTTVASIDRETQRERDDVRRKILEDELAQEEQSLADVREIAPRRSSRTRRSSPPCASPSRPTDPTPAQQVEMRANIDKASGRIRGLQATVAEHEKNIEALKKELGALKP